MKLTLKIRLLSDTTFGRGDGVSGLVDQEIEHDPATGLPIIRGRTLKGLLVEECANILYAAQHEAGYERLWWAADRLFGHGGSSLQDGGALRVGTAHIMPQKLREFARADIENGSLQPADILEMFTTIRRQTAVDEETGAPAEKSLRTSRVLLRAIELASAIEVNVADNDGEALPLLTACVCGLRRGGTGRNRGRGRLEVTLDGCDMPAYLNYFERLAKGQQ